MRPTSQLKRPTREDVLCAFAIEPTHTPTVLTEYLQRYPWAKRDLILLHMALNVPDSHGDLEHTPDDLEA